MRFSTYFLFFFISISVLGQFKREKNIIVPLTHTDFSFSVSPIGEEGIVLFKEVINLENKLKRKWEVISLDKELTLNSSSTFESDLNFVISSVKPYSDYIYLMFQDTNIPIEKVYFLRFNIGLEYFEVFEIGGVLPREILGFEVLGNSLFLVGANQKRPVILKFNYGDSRPKVLKGLFDERSEILHSSVNQELGFIQVITRMKQKGKESTLIIKQFDESGVIVKDLLISSPKGYQMLNALATTDNLGKTSVVGTFSYKKSKLSNGIFSAVFQEGQQNNLYYYDYPNLLNYFDYLLIPEDIEKSKQKYAGGGEAKSIKVNHIPRKLIDVGNELIYLGEVLEFSEKYSESNAYVGQQEFAKYSHAIAIGLDDNGKIKWDNTLSLNGKTSVTAFQQSQIGQVEENMVIFYTDGFVIHHKMFQGNNALTGNQLFIVDSNISENSEHEIIKFGNILHWYGDTFISFGESSWYDDLNKLHRSFYLNKIQLGTTLSQ